MRIVSLAAVAIVTAAALGCEQQSAPTSAMVPQATPLFSVTPGDPCSTAVLSAITAQQAALWSGSSLDSSRARFHPVERNCGTQAGKDSMLFYIAWTISNRAAIIPQNSGTPESNLLGHWNTVFPYVGYTGEDQPSAVPVSIFSPAGAAGVVPWNAQGEVAAAAAAITSYPQDASGDRRDHLLVIYPIPANCLTGTNLTQFGPCFEFSSFPKVSPKFSPRVKLGICQPLRDDESIPLSTPALGHLAPVTRIAENAGTYPAFCGDVAEMPAGSWNAGFGGVVKRLAWIAKKAMTPEPLYAVHGGLGGLGSGLSPYGAVDVQVFNSTFSSDAAGAPPGNPETGTWFQEVTQPGSILVQTSLGLLNSNLVVLNQGGGNCNKCGGLLLKGNLSSSGPAATDGVYQVEFVALQDQANMKEAVFAIRDTQGRDIARVTYAVRSNVKLILYNDRAGVTGVKAGSWVRSKPDQFLIQIDLNARTTSLWFNGNPVVGAVGVPFVNSGAADLASVSADFRGIDSGKIGWDNIRITRLADQ